MKKTAKKIVAGTVGAAGLFLASAATAVNADSVHHVVKNDTVWALSQKFGVSIKSIEQLNHIDQNTNMIYVGQDLQIPNKDAQAPKNNTHTYTVQSGDSLWAIAQKFNTSVDHLKQLNGLTSNLIYVGQTLKVDGQAVAQPAKAATPAPAKTVAQPVQQQAPVTKASVASTTQKAAPVQQAQQPSAQSTVKSTPAVQSTVKQAPVVSSVSSATPASSATQAQPATSSVATSKVAPAVSSSQAPVSSFASSASVSSSSASQQTVASSSSSQTSIASSVSSAAPASSVSSQSSSKQAVIAANHTTATVKSGDSLYAIAQEYGVSVASLREANPSLGNSLTVGQSLIINNPTKNPAAAASSSSQQAQASSASSQQQARTANNQQAAQSNNNQQQNNNNQAAQASSQAQQSSTTRTGSGNNVVSYAESFIGVPYVYGGTTPSGFDCSGFVQYVYNHFGKSLPRTTTQQENCGTQIPVNQAQPGDLYFWGNKGSAYHVAICVGNGKYIAAPEPGQSVSIGSTQYFQPSFAVRL
ncbi:C40 family peptidase [Ligilactobacillus aviarius]|uniref:C40 family peptidase n=1 Tax=Ligilactobacillus aviarius TaxID=1606 RepID=UPI00249E3386|nr:LysM peptidoglycan-binding domain-containing protein [Ligilactobacillus aviarius]